MLVAKKGRASSASLPAPVGGWNARDPLAAMAPTDAVDLINWYPQTSDVRARKGHSQHATGLPTFVDTLLSYNGAATSELFAISNGAIYDTTTSGAVGAAVVSGLSNSRFEYVNVSTSGGNFMLAINGLDKLQGYNGTSWWVDGDATHDITGLDTATCSAINLHKTRVWLIQKNTLLGWYLPVNSIAGAATSFDFRSIARRGGYLVAMGTWTIDSGYGMDDQAVFITSEGEVIVYRGTDPSSASTWALVGVYEIGRPIGTRCFMKYQGDLLLITQDGVVPLSGALQSSRVNPRVAITNKIQSAISSAATTYATNFGWQMVFFAQADMLLLNVPVLEHSSQEQYVMNTITKAWARFQDWEANCWVIHNNNLYFGGDTFVGKAWDTFFDNGNAILTTASQAFNYFGARGKLKRWTMMRPVFMTNGNLDIYARLNVDFEDTGVAALVTFAATSAAVWDTAVWDAGTWGSGLSPHKAWQGVNGVGYCASVHVQTGVNGVDVTWVSTDVIMEPGAML